MIFVADVAGQHDGLLRLLKKMPNERTLFLGDLIDRGPKSREVVALVREKYESLLGNHEHFMIDFVGGYSWYEPNIWLANGGAATLKSYGFDPLSLFKPAIESKEWAQMESDADWMRGLPVFFENDHVFASHAPWDSGLDFDQVKGVMSSGPLSPEPTDYSLIWGRSPPKFRKFKDVDGLIAEPFGKPKLQIFGHNSYWGVKKFFNGTLESPGFMYAICLDDSSKKRVTGLHVDDETGTATVYQEPY